MKFYESGSVHLGEMELCACRTYLLAPGKSLSHDGELHKRARCWIGDGWWFRDSTPGADKAKP